MTATLIGFVAAFLAGLLLILVAALIDADTNTRIVPDVDGRDAGYHTHPCWAEYDRAVLSSNRAVVAAEMATVRAAYPPAAVVHIGQRETVMV